MKIKPLSRPGYTMFNNYILDHIMPDLSPSGWKILCVAIRQTIGWVDEDTESGRKEADRISYSQFQTKTSLSSKTVARGIKENLSKGYLLRSVSPDHSQAYDYRLNMDYEIDVETTGESTEVEFETTGESTEVGPISPKTTGESTEETTGESTDTKERVKKGEMKRNKFVSSPLIVEVEI